MEEKLFSVVIPAYNREKTISRSIDSVLNQTYSNFEIIVVDDGSIDTTKAVVEPYLKDNRVSYLYQVNAGAQRARNNGLSRAKGEYILFLDSDDELLPECLKKMAGEYESDEKIGAVYFLTGLRDGNGSIKLVRKDTLEGNVYKEVLEQGYLTSSSFISMRRKIFEKIGNWDEAFPASQDDDMCFRISKYYRIKLLNEILGVYGTDAGPGKQIGSSAKRVANGWWLLWNKYEKDVIKYCGGKTMQRHYFECAVRFKNVGQKDKYLQSKTKIKGLSRNIEYFFNIYRISLVSMAQRAIQKIRTSIQ